MNSSSLSDFVDAIKLNVQGSEKLLAAGAVVTTSYLLYSLYRPKHDEGPKMVLVTGCASGIGRATAETLMKKGDFVVGSDIDEKGLESLRQAYPMRFYGLVMNVSDPVSVEKAAQKLLEYSKKPCLDAIVNNAGIIRGGPLTELGDKDMAAIMNVNVLGSFYVTKYFFPLLNRQKDSAYKPRILNLGSEVSYAQISACFNGPYAMTKFAVEAYSASLRQELSLLEAPVHVVVLNPGAHLTGMTKANGAALGDAQMKKKSVFAKALVKGEPVAQAYMDRHGKPAENVAQNVFRLVHLLNPPRRQKINVSLEMELGRLTPQAILDKAVAFTFGG